MGVKTDGFRPLRRLLRDRRGTSEIVGSVMFLVILFFFFTNVYLWHDQATRKMDNVVADKINSKIKVRCDVANNVINITNTGGVGAGLSRLWISIKSGDQNGDHVYADLENIEGIERLWLSPGATIELNLNSSASGPYVSPVDVSRVDSGDVVQYVVQYAPEGGDVFKVLTTIGNSAAETFIAYELSVSTVGNGSVTKHPDQVLYAPGTVVELTATAELGWTFSDWSGDLTSTANPETIVMDGDKTVTATFTQDEYVIDVTVSPSDAAGTVEFDQPEPYVYSDVVTMTPIANPGYTFFEWSGDGVDGAGDTRVVTVTGNMSVTATFTQDQYTLTVEVVGSGSVSKSPDQVTYIYGDSVVLTPTADPGWTFAGFSDNVIDGSVTVYGDTSVTATFTQDQYTLTVNVFGDGGVVKVPDLGTYTYGVVVDLTAVPGVGWSFSFWGGDASGTELTTSITMDGDKTVTATFTQDEYTLTVEVSPAGSGTFDVSPVQATYHYGDSVTLTATAELGWTFSDWSGDLTSTANPETIVMDGDKTVTATFTQNIYTLDVIVSPEDYGSVSRNNTGPYVYGDVVELTAVPIVGWSFGGWSGDASGTELTTSVVMDDNKNVTATFTQDQYTLTVNVDGAGCSVTKDPDLPTYTYGTVVELTAVEADGWTFSAWGVDASGSGLTTFVTMDGDKSVTATFTQDEYTLTIITVGNGDVVKAPDLGTYTYGEVVELTAVAEAGWTFSGWSGDVEDSLNPVQVIMDGDKSVTATFTQDQYTLMVGIVGSGSVTKSPEQATYTYGSVVTLDPTADVGWTFQGWTGDLSGSDDPGTIIMDGDKTVTATFTEDGV